MPNILYYSRNCQNSQSLLAILNKSPPKDTMFFSVDSRENTPTGTYLILDNGSRVLLPVNVLQVPSLLVIDEMTKKMSYL